jgi:hypothetical protein
MNLCWGFFQFNAGTSLGKTDAYLRRIEKEMLLLAVCSLCVCMRLFSDLSNWTHYFEPEAGWVSSECERSELSPLHHNAHPILQKQKQKCLLPFNIPNVCPEPVLANIRFL